MNTRMITASAMIFALGASSAMAADVKLSGLVFGQYARHLSQTDTAGVSSKNRGEFGITRIYMNAEAKFSPKVKGKVVLESNTTQTTDTGHGSNSVFLKQAFGDYMVNDYANVQFGLVGTPWIGFEEGIWGRRFISKVFVDSEGVVSSADKGVGVLLKIPNDFGDFHAAHVNGEGTTAVEKTGKNGRHKDSMARLTLSPMVKFEPLSGLKLHGYIHNGRAQDGDNYLRDRVMGGVSYQHKRFHAMVSSFKARTGAGVKNTRSKGYSLHGSLKLPLSLSAFSRYDFYDPDTETSSDGRARTLWGVDYKVAEGVRISVNDQIVRQQLATNTSANENRLFFQLEMKF